MARYNVNSWVLLVLFCDSWGCGFCTINYRRKAPEHYPVSTTLSQLTIICCIICSCMYMIVYFNVYYLYIDVYMRVRKRV
uniref:Secreted protein n=1 Tax=Anopheles darlingi TaxID=43151 RepID=A0A2M4DFS5_ANODA